MVGGLSSPPPPLIHDSLGATRGEHMPHDATPPGAPPAPPHPASAQPPPPYSMVTERATRESPVLTTTTPGYLRKMAGAKEG